MKPDFINAYELGQMLFADDCQKWGSLYGALNQGTGSDSCARELIENRSVRMVIKLKGRNTFWAVHGHLTDEQELDGLDAVEFPAGMYVSASDDSDEVTYHSHLFTHENRPITLVDVKQVATFDDKALAGEVRKSPWMESFHKEKITGYRYVACSIKALQVVDSWKRLYRDDVIGLLAGVKNTDSQSDQSHYSNAPEQPEGNRTELDQASVDALCFVEHIQTGRLGAIYYEEVNKYRSGKQDWDGQDKCKKRLTAYNKQMDSSLSALETETVTKMLTDLFSKHGKQA